MVGVRFTESETVWYPVRSDRGEQMRMRDYVPRLEDADAILHARGVSDEAIVDLFDTIMRARRDAPPLQRRFPTLVIVPKPGETAADHAMLAEDLASHGYVVRFSHDTRGATVLEHRVSTWDFAVDRERALRELERVREALPARARP